MSEMSHDFPPELDTEVNVLGTRVAAYLCEQLIISNKTFKCVPDIESNIHTLTLSEDDAKYAIGLIAEQEGKLVVMYKGHRVRCYGKMSLDENVWWATEEEEGILTHGYETWDDAVRDFIDRMELPVVELGAT